MSNTKPIIVYWAVHTKPENQYRLLLNGISFKSVMRDIAKRHPKNPIIPKTKHSNQNRVAQGRYHMCSALHELVDNMFYLNTPFDVHLELEDNGTIKPFDKISWFVERGQTMDNAFSVDFDYEVSVFCEESLEMTVTSPYMHKTDLFKYGFVSSVKWDISKWFRPIVAIFQLWPDVKELKLKENEPFIYIHFDTERPVVFKQFRMTDTILNISLACLQDKVFFPFTSLKKLYKKFIEQGIQKDLIKEIKANVIE